VLAWKVILGDEGVGKASSSGRPRAEGNPISQLPLTGSKSCSCSATIWLPIIALPIFVSTRASNRRLLEAGERTRGANRLRPFRKRGPYRSPRGDRGGVLFVVIPTLGEFVTQSLVG